MKTDETPPFDFLPIVLTILGWRIFSAPVIYAATAGLLINLSGWTAPEPLSNALPLLGLAMAPTSLVVRFNF